MIFKVNDRVVIVESIYGCEQLSEGQTGVVLQVISDIMFGVKMDNGYDYLHGMGTWMFTENELKLIEEE